MSILGKNYLTLVDLLKRTVKDSVETDIAEIMSEDDVVIKDAHVKQCNDGTNNISVIRSGLPEAVFRKLYGFVPSSKSETEQVVDTTGMLETYSVVDVDLVDKSENPAAFRLSESKSFIEGMTQKAVQTVFYGSKKDNNAEFDGLSVRYSTISKKPHSIGNNMVDGGSETNENTSVWIVTWSDNDTFLLYPKGSTGGIQHKNDGIQTETNDTGAKRKVYQDHFKWDLGIGVKDWRSTARICNISVKDLLDGKLDTIGLLRKAYYKVKKYIRKSGQKTFIYCNSTFLEQLDAAASNKANVQLTIKNFDGEDILCYRNIPIRCTDVILDTEEKVLSDEE